MVKKVNSCKLKSNALTVDVNISVTVQKALAFTTLLARRLILLKWKHVSPPSFDTWLKEVFTCIKLEKNETNTHWFFKDL